ncbi:hypothetical protein [Amycolatopsis cihanbeyliensis]|nr:hypothetical protein [Amycolatopsis cihanbeyliensis]
MGKLLLNMAAVFARLDDGVMREDRRSNHRRHKQQPVPESPLGDQP